MGDEQGQALHERDLRARALCAGEVLGRNVQVLVGEIRGVGAQVADQALHDVGIKLDVEAGQGHVAGLRGKQMDDCRQRTRGNSATRGAYVARRAGLAIFPVASRGRGWGSSTM
jgi:hypothetical protein